MKYFSLLAFLFALPLTSRAAQLVTSHRTSIAVSCACQDPGGKAYLEAVHQVLAADPKFKEVGANEATNETIRIQIVSSVIMPKSALEIPKTGLSVTCMQNGAPILSQDIETCHSYPVSIFVKNLLAELSGS